MTISIGEFVRARRAKRERTTAKQVMEYLLVSQKVLHIPKESDGLYCKKEYNSTYRNVRRFVAKLGYCRGRRTGNMVPSTALLLKRVQYLKSFHNNRIKSENERLREVYNEEDDDDDDEEGLPLANSNESDDESNNEDSEDELNTEDFEDNLAEV